MLTVRSVAVPALALAVAAGLSGCGSDDKSAGHEKSSKPSASGTATSAAPYLDVGGDVELTAPGTKLGLGQEGVVAWEPRQGVIVAAGVTVERIERTSFQESFPDWNVSDVTAARTPYFVRVKVTNPAENPLAGVSLQLWGADDGGTLEAPNFYDRTQLPACSGATAMPPGIRTETPYEMCQVYFIAPGRTLTSVNFQPPAGIDAVTWSGEISKVAQPKSSKKSKKDKKTGKAKHRKKAQQP
ncbi:MAG TPA: hypothetical protein VNS81_10360 [Nocardioides sp.]|nr:hypothetical protein [Nocardioides sp.]